MGYVEDQALKELELRKQNEIVQKQDLNGLYHQDPMAFFQKYYQHSNRAPCIEILKNHFVVTQWFLAQTGYKATDFLIACVEWEDNVPSILESLNHAVHSQVVCAIIAKHPAYAYYMNDLEELDLLKYHEIRDILMAMANHKECLPAILEYLEENENEYSATRMHVLSACMKLDRDFANEMISTYPNNDLILSSMLYHYKDYALQYARMRFCKESARNMAIRFHIEVAREFVNKTDYNSMSALITHPSLHDTVLNRKDLPRDVLINLIKRYFSVAEHYVNSNEVDILFAVRSHSSLFELIALRSDLPTEFYKRFSESIYRIREAHNIQQVA